jgi:uncharacterized protein YhfF
MRLKDNEQKYWQSYLSRLSAADRPKDPVVTAGYAGNPEITDELLKLYLSGLKTAGSSLLEDFVSANDPVPQVGNYWIFLNSHAQPSCILKTAKIEMNKFKDIPASIAIAEGEGDLSLDYWKRVHSELYSPLLKSWGISDINEATVITEFFEIVYR